MNGTMNGHTDTQTSLDQARAKIAGLIKIDVLPASQELDNEATIKMVERNFITDTVTVPTKEMIAYGARASLEDDVFFEPNTDALQKHLAKVAGKDAGIFLPSGTMSNQIAIRTLLQQPPYSVICDVRAHLYQHEAGGMSFHSGANPQPVTPKNGHHLTLEDIEDNVVLYEDPHYAPTAIISLENPLRGAIFPQDEIERIAEFAHKNQLKMHLDGARLWHVAAETGTSLETLCKPFDTVSLCLSKGIGAPIGTVLVGSQAVIKKARWFRKLFGGGMRQTGFLAACAAYALTHNFPRLSQVHALTRKLQQGLEELGVGVPGRAETSMILYDPTTIGVRTDEVKRRCLELPEPITLRDERLVVHLQTTEKAVEDLLAVIKQLKEEKSAAHVNGDSKSKLKASGY